MTDHANLTRRDFARSAAFAAALAPLASSNLSAATRTESAAHPDAARPAQPAIRIDALASPGPFNVPDRTARPLSSEMLDNARASGITAVNVTVNAFGEAHEAFDATARELGYWFRELATHPDRLLQVRSVGDIRAAAQSGRLGLIFGFQDAVMLEDDLDRLRMYHDYGVRVIQLTYNLSNHIGDGCLVPQDRGLSPFGVRVVEAMNARGILIDLSHCGQRTTADAIRTSARPVAVTHSGCDAVFAHPRNKRDTELRALADKGGVLGIFMMPFLNAEGPPQLEHFIAHVEHALDVCGEDHVGVGSDNSITPTVADEAYLKALFAFADERKRLGIGAPREHEVLFVEGLNTVDRMQRIGDALRARGHTATRIDKILGGNWVRLFGDVWA